MNHFLKENVLIIRYVGAGLKPAPTGFISLLLLLLCHEIQSDPLRKHGWL